MLPMLFWNENKYLHPHNRSHHRLTGLLYLAFFQNPVQAQCGVKQENQTQNLTRYNYTHQ